MRRRALLVCFSFGLLACASSPRDESNWRVGEPCVTADEAATEFGGYSENEVSIEGGGSCGAVNVCLVHDFRGRASCPSGQSDGAGGCRTPSGDAVVVAVPAQLPTRPADIGVVCSCRCDGPDPTADYCACPDGMSCRELVRASGDARTDFAGSYCVY